MAIHDAYPPEVHSFVRVACRQFRDRELAAEANRLFGTSFTESKMKSFRTNHGYKSGRGRLSREEWRERYHPPGMYEFVRDNSWGVPSKEMAEMVNARFGTSFTPASMKQFRQRNGIKCGITGWFQKGHEPGNKGKKLEEYVTNPDRLEDIRRRMAPTQFKKGGKPPNELPVGAVTVNAEGYKLRKRRMEGTQWERWEFLHRAVWEEANGPVPPGMRVIFLDGDKLNCSPENLALVTAYEQLDLTRRGYRSEDPDVTKAGLTLVRLRKAARDKKRKAAGKLPEAR